MFSTPGFWILITTCAAGQQLRSVDHRRSRPENQARLPRRSLSSGASARTFQHLLHQGCTGMAPVRVETVLELGHISGSNEANWR